jgi:NADH dehydrogenase
MHKHRIVIIGGGFAGLNAALALADAPAEVTLIDRRNFHLFQPLLYQVASGALSPANIATPLREILRKQRNTRVIMGEVVNIDPAFRLVMLADGECVPYDFLVIGAGAGHSYFGNDNWQSLAPGLKTIEDATEIRQRLLMAFEAAERSHDPAEIRRLLTFVIVGGGPTGVELAGALGEITRETLRGNFRTINPADASIYLVEHAPRVLPPYAPNLSKKAAEALRELGVQVRTSTLVVDVEPDFVTLRTGDEDAPLETIPTATVIWAAGVTASPLGKVLAGATGARQDRNGRVFVSPDFSVPGHPQIFVVGDLAHYEQDNRVLPGVAPVAMQEGRYVGTLIAKRLKGKRTRAFKYRDYGSMATIGRGRAVADLGGLRFSGFLAWSAWLLVHLLKLVDFHNKALVLLQWGWNYFTRNRSARLITGLRLPPKLQLVHGGSERKKLAGGATVHQLPPRRS